MSSVNAASPQMASLKAYTSKMAGTDADGDNDGTRAAAPVKAPAAQTTQSPAAVVSLSPAAQEMLKKG